MSTLDRDPEPGVDPAAIATDPDAFERFYRDQLPVVRRFVARRASDAGTAADLTADIFVAAIESASSYRRDKGTPTAWLLGIARHVVAGEARRHGRQTRLIARIEGRRLLDADSLGRVEERLDAEREVRRIYRALAALPEPDRALMELVAVDGMTIADAAAQLGVKPGTARVRLHRSRARIESLLEAPLDAAGPTEEAHR